MIVFSWRQVSLSRGMVLLQQGVISTLKIYGILGTGPLYPYKAVKLKKNLLMSKFNNIHNYPGIIPGTVPN